MTNLVGRLRNYVHGIDYSMLHLEAADEIERLRKLLDGRTFVTGAVEPDPQAPIAQVRIWGHMPPDVKIYAPGLPPGEHDLYCEPMSVAPALKPSEPQNEYAVYESELAERQPGDPWPTESDNWVVVCKAERT